jgi:hypothetical protein
MDKVAVADSQFNNSRQHRWDVLRFGLLPGPMRAICAVGFVMFVFPFASNQATTEGQ